MTSSTWTTEVTNGSEREVRSSFREVADGTSRFSVKRTGLASLLFALFRPEEAKAVTVNADSVMLAFGSRSQEIALRDIEAVHLNAGRRWGGVTLGHAVVKPPSARRPGSVARVAGACVCDGSGVNWPRAG